MTTPTTRQLRTLDLSLGPGCQTLRVAWVGPGEDEPAALVLSVGFGGSRGSAFLRPAWGDLPLRLPAEIIPRLVEALGALEEQPDADASKVTPEVARGL